MSSGIGDTLANAICVSVYVYAMCKKSTSENPKNGSDSLDLELQLLASPGCRCWELNLDPLQNYKSY